MALIKTINTSLEHKHKSDSDCIQVQLVYAVGSRQKTVASCYTCGSLVVHWSVNFMVGLGLGLGHIGY